MGGNVRHRVWWNKGAPPREIGDYLVWLAKPVLNSNCHTMTTRATSNGGFISILAGMMLFDALDEGNKIVAWTMCPEGPFRRPGMEWEGPSDAH